MVHSTQVSQEQTTPSIPRQIADEICLKLAWIVDKTVTKPLLALGSLAQAVAAPVMYGSIALTALHIAIRPTQSQNIAKKLLHASPKALESAIQYVPIALKGVIDISHRVYRTSLNTLGETLGLPKSALQLNINIETEISLSKPTHSLSTVLAGLATTSYNRAINCRPAGIISSLDSLLTHSENALTQMVQFSKETAAPWAINQFNTTFPKV